MKKGKLYTKLKYVYILLNGLCKKKCLFSMGIYVIGRIAGNAALLQKGPSLKIMK